MLLFQRLKGTSESQIYRIHLNLKEQEELVICRKHLITLTLNHSKVDLINVKKVSFSIMGLSRIEPEIFSELPNLEFLDLGYNELVELDKDLFKNLTALKKLLLNNNKITKYE